MSETVLDSGRLVPIYISEEEAKSICKALLVDLDFYQSAKEALACETEEYAIIDGLGFCRVENFKSTDPNENWCTIVKNIDGSYDFRTSYYNGGAHWTECVAAELKRSKY